MGSVPAVCRHPRFKNLLVSGLVGVAALFAWIAAALFHKAYKLHREQVARDD